MFSQSRQGQYHHSERSSTANLVKQKLNVHFVMVSFICNLFLAHHHLVFMATHGKVKRKANDVNALVSQVAAAALLEWQYELQRRISIDRRLSLGPQ